MIKIGLVNIETYAYHGVFSEEQKKGTIFLTDVDVWFKSNKSIKSDKLEDTFDYQIIYDVVIKEMEQPSHLIEHLAGRILNSLASKDERIKKIRIKIAKTNPPIAGKAEKSTVEVKLACN